MVKLIADIFLFQTADRFVIYFPNFFQKNTFLSLSQISDHFLSLWILFETVFDSIFIKSFTGTNEYQITSFHAPYKFFKHSLNFVTGHPFSPLFHKPLLPSPGQPRWSPAQRHAGKPCYRGRTFDGALVQGSRGRTLDWSRRVCEFWTSEVTEFRMPEKGKFVFCVKWKN